MGLYPQENADLATFTEEMLNEKLHFLCSALSFSFRIGKATVSKIISETSTLDIPC